MPYLMVYVQFMIYGTFLAQNSHSFLQEGHTKLPNLSNFEDQFSVFFSTLFLEIGQDGIKIMKNGIFWTFFRKVSRSMCTFQQFRKIYSKGDEIWNFQSFFTKICKIQQIFRSILAISIAGLIQVKTKNHQKSIFLVNFRHFLAIFSNRNAPISSLFDEKCQTTE